MLAGTVGTAIEPGTVDPDGGEHAPMPITTTALAAATAIARRDCRARPSRRIRSGSVVAKRGATGVRVFIGRPYGRRRRADPPEEPFDIESGSQPGMRLRGVGRAAA